MVLVLTESVIGFGIGIDQYQIPGIGIGIDQYQVSGIGIDQNQVLGVLNRIFASCHFVTLKLFMLLLPKNDFVLLKSNKTI